MMKQTVPCVWCGGPTMFTATKKCTRCWELYTRIRDDITLAKKMIEAIERDKPK